MTTTWAAYLEQNSDRFQAELMDFLKIESISSLPQHAPDVRHAAEWVKTRLGQAGLENTRIMETGGHPVVYADWLHAPGKPTLLVYGHFDVQPVDPVHLWTTPPFTPTVRDGRVFARGASDDKGNMLVPILALEALLRGTGTLPVNIKFLLEGQEEIGSPQLPAFIAQHKDVFTCDLVVNADSGQAEEGQPGLLLSTKGLAGLQIDLETASTDMHSGLYGGAVQNPLHAMAELIASMHDTHGRIAVDGFYDDVVELTAAERAGINDVPFNPDALKAQLGLSDFYGEAGYTVPERLAARPTLEVNGLWGGFQGEGVKTVIPREAHAKITCRLVANQSPERVRELIKTHVLKHAPVGSRVSVSYHNAGALPYMMPSEHPANRVATDVLHQIYGKQPWPMRSGGTIPVLSLFLQHLGAYTLGFGFGLPDERFHAPDEFWRLESFQTGQRAYCLLFERLGQGW